MSRAFRCDRCNLYYSSNSINFENKKIAKVRTVNTDGYNVTENDLCDDCVIQFINFMNGKEIKRIETLEERHA